MGGEIGVCESGTRCYLKKNIEEVVKSFIISQEGVLDCDGYDKRV